MSKLWGGRFKKKIDPVFERFSASLKWDGRLLPYDLQINEAYALALRKCGVLTAAEETRLRSALKTLQQKLSRADFLINEVHEDVHSFVQSELKKKLGELADKIHTGRSRNDLVAQSSRLYCKKNTKELIELLLILQKEIVLKAEASQKIYIPGMTHLQNAQILSQAHIFLSYAEMLERSKAALSAAVEFADVCVLGSGALAGSTFKVDQKLIAKKLGLARITSNSYDVSGDRDFILQLLFALSMLGVHLSRIAEDFMIAQTKGFGFVDLDESLCTGSSMMPQKKNADFVELSRGASGLFLGNLLSLAVTLKGLPTSYNRDLQWDKRTLFESVETAKSLLFLFTRLFKTLEIRADKIQEFLKDENLYATDLADYLVRKGVAFHIAHEQVGQIVSFAETNDVPISKIGLDLLKKFAPKLDGGVYDLFSPDHSARLKKTQGSTHPDFVRQQIQQWKKRFRR